MHPPVKIVFASGTGDLNRRLIAEMRALYPELPLWIVSDFPPEDPEDRDLKWLPYHQNRTFRENLARCRAALKGIPIRLAAVMLVPNVPFRRMRLLALVLSPKGFIAFNENLNNFMLRPRSVPAILKHCAWRVKNFLRHPTIARTRIAVPAPEPVAIFPGRSTGNKPKVLIASCYTIFPLSHGGAVRMYNLMQRAAKDFDQILIAFTDEITPPPDEILNICAEVVLVQRTGSHSLDVVGQFASRSFRNAVREAVRKWNPAIAQLEFTQMAQYADDCKPARTILVEHDITFDLYEQMLRVNEDWETRRQFDLWKRFELKAWKHVDRVVTMSEKDRRLVGHRAVTLPNGVDLERFQPRQNEPNPRRILFIGSFAHLPNLMALQFFVTQVWPLLEAATLHVIAGSKHEYFLDFYRMELDLNQPGIEVEGFVSDVRPAYETATVVIAPLIASAGTNIKVLEAMAMGRAVVSTSAGINGLELSPGKDMILANTGPEMAAAITRLCDCPAERKQIEANARATVEREFGWDTIARHQAALYGELCGS